MYIELVEDIFKRNVSVIGTSNNTVGTENISISNEENNVNVIYATSVLRKRKTKMNKHKRRKRIKKQKFLMRKLGKA